MDWNTLKSKLNPYIDQAKEYTKKVAQFAESQIQTTPLFLKTKEEYEAWLTEKRGILLAYDETHEDIASEIRFASSVWITYAFTDAAKLRFLSISEYPELTHHIGVVGPIEMRVRYDGSETFHFSDIDSIRAWWKKRCYIPDTTTPDDAPVIPVDPLAHP